MAEEEDIYTKDGTVDYRNKPANKKKTGTWKACPYILGDNINSLSLSSYSRVSGGPIKCSSMP